MARQAPLSVGFSRQEYWNVLPFPSPGELPDPGIEVMSPALADRFFTPKAPGKPRVQEDSIFISCPDSVPSMSCMSEIAAYPLTARYGSNLNVR